MKVAFLRKCTTLCAEVKAKLDTFSILEPRKVCKDSFLQKGRKPLICNDNLSRIR